MGDKSLKEIKRRTKYTERLAKRKGKDRIVFKCPNCNNKQILLKIPKFCPKCEKEVSQSDKEQEKFVLTLKDKK